MLMKKKIYSRSTLVFFLCFVLHLSTNAQTRKYFIITGKFISETEFIEHGEIQIIKKDKSAVSSPVPLHGRFRLELDYNSDYQLTFIQDGRLPKTIVVNTEIPKEVYLRSVNFPHFVMAVKLFNDKKEVSNIYYSGDQKQQINYSAQQDCFVRVPTIFDVELVDKGNQLQAPAIHSQENKSKMQTYQVF